MKKRATERITTKMKAEFTWSDKIISGSVMNLSENGLLVNTHHCPPLRSRFNLSIPLEDDVLKVPVKVRRLVKKDHLYDAMGLETVDPPQKYLDFVSTLRWKHIKGGNDKGQVKKLFTCKTCQHISFNHAPVSCPICMSTIENFEKTPLAINNPDNSLELSDFEKKHIPVISVSKENGLVNAHIQIGEVEHEMDSENCILFIDSYYKSQLNSKQCISRISFNCEKMHPSATLSFKDINTGSLTIASKCCKHGTWISKVKF